MNNTWQTSKTKINIIKDNKIVTHNFLTPHLRNKKYTWYQLLKDALSLMILNFQAVAFS